jgi:hypothetical protein
MASAGYATPNTYAPLRAEHTRESLGRSVRRAPSHFSKTASCVWENRARFNEVIRTVDPKRTRNPLSTQNA